MKRGPAGRAARLQLALTLGLAALCAALALLALDARRAGKDIPAGAENASVPDSNAEAAAPVPTAPGNPEPGLRPLSVLACGDILLARTPGKRAAERGFRYLFEGVRGLVSSADLAFANLETPAAYTGAPYPGKPENVTFRADPATLFGLAWAEIGRASCRERV